MPRVEMAFQDVDSPDGRTVLITMKPSLENLDRAVKESVAARTPANMLALQFVEFMQKGRKNLKRKDNGLIVPTGR